MLEGPSRGQGALMLEDLDPAETREWVEALDSVLAFEGADRAFYLLDEVTAEARRKGAPVPYRATTPYLNTIPPDKEVRLSPRELATDHRIRSMIRWNALAMVLRANAESSQLRGPVARLPRPPRPYDARLLHFFRSDSESLGAIALASRKKLDNLIFVINCNLQRLDGPVRGNGKIIQELEGIFRGAGWNVIKTIWGSGWDPLIARDSSGLLLKRMEEAVDGEYQDFKSKDGAHVREKIFGKDPELAEMVAGMTDDEIWALNRGGHDPVKVYAAYSAAVRHAGQPTVILAKTIKGYGMGESGEGQNITHQQKHMASAALVKFRDRFGLPLTDEQLAELPFLRFDEDSEEMAYLRERRAAPGGGPPSPRRPATPTPAVPHPPPLRGPPGGP